MQHIHCLPIGHHKCREQWPAETPYERIFNITLVLLLLALPLFLMCTTYKLITDTLWQGIVAEQITRQLAAAPKAPALKSPANNYSNSGRSTDRRRSHSPALTFNYMFGPPCAKNKTTCAKNKTTCRCHGAAVERSHGRLYGHPARPAMPASASASNSAEPTPAPPQIHSRNESHDDGTGEQPASLYACTAAAAERSPTPAAGAGSGRLASAVYER